jgi:hypothetical protein
MGWGRAHSKLALVLGVSVLAVVGAVTALVAFAGGGGGAPVLPTTGAYAPISVSRPVVPTLGGGVLHDPDSGATNHLSTMVSKLPGAHRFRLTVTNTSNLGFINSFQWYPPIGVGIVKVLGSSAGHCAVNGLTGFGGKQFQTVLLHPNILCDKVNVKPPSCTCLGDGGSVTISFVADRELPALGTARMISATLVFDPIPSYLTPEITSQQQVPGSQG